MYRSPGRMSDRFIEKCAMVSRDKYIKKLRDLILHPRKKLLVMGDYNYNLDPITARKFRGNEEKILTELLKQGTFSNLMEGKKTHLSRIHNTTTTCDLVLVVPRIETSNVTVEEFDVLAGLDHFPIMFEIVYHFKIPPRRNINTRGKIFKNKPFCKSSDTANLTREFEKLKLWERDNSDKLNNLFSEWDNNPKIGTEKIFETFGDMVDKVMPPKIVQTKNGNSRFPLSPLFYELRTKAKNLRIIFGSTCRSSKPYADLQKKLERERKRSLRQVKNREATERTQSQKGSWSMTHGALLMFIRTRDTIFLTN